MLMKNSMNTKIFLSLTSLFMTATNSYALPTPAAVWACLQSSDPAMESDSDGPAGSNPVLCHLEKYTVKESQKTLHIDSQFKCLMDNGERKNVSGTADCLAR